MPELPEVEVLVRHLGPLLQNKRIRGVEVRRNRVLAGTSRTKLRKALEGARFTAVSRRGKYLLFALRAARSSEPIMLVGHLGMTGRIYLMEKKSPLPKHTAVAFDLGRQLFVFEDTRYFGKLTLDRRGVEKLGLEPLGAEFTVDLLAKGLGALSQPIKVKLLDQSLVAGIGNIYASEALFRAGISPRIPARDLNGPQLGRLRQAIRDVLTKAIQCGSTVPLNYSGQTNDAFFYFGRSSGANELYEERLSVYDRAGEPCVRCGNTIQRLVQSGRSTYYCSVCQSVS